MYKRNFLISVVISIFLIALSQVAWVEADSGYQPGLQHLYPYYAPQVSSANNSLPDISVDETQEGRHNLVYDFGQQNLYFNNQGAVIFGSGLYSVSRLDPLFMDNGLCGIAAWHCTGDRWARFENFSQIHSLDAESLSAQLLFINLELNNFGAQDTAYQEIYNLLANSTSFQATSDAFMQNYLGEQPLDLSQLAEQLYEYQTVEPEGAQPVVGLPGSGSPGSQAETTPNLDPRHAEPPSVPPVVEPPPTDTGANLPVFHPSTIECRAGAATGYIATTTAGDSQGPYLQRLTVISHRNPQQQTFVYAHRCLHASLSNLLQNYNAGVSNPDHKLGGWVWRSHQRQIELRKKHCGTSQYDIYEKSPNACRPPTARPGQSSHQDGLAIDFYCKGTTLTRTNCNQAFRWLDCNAAQYGLINLSSESWHWYFPLRAPHKLSAKIEKGC